jgi:cysteine desulfurase
MKRTIYLDHNATTPLDPRALEAMMPYLTSEFGNPSSATHDWGLRARQAVEEARCSVAALIHARPEEIVFTSGATESNNLAVKGAARAAAAGGKPVHVVASALEHASVRESAKALEREGIRTSELPSDPAGIARVDALPALIAEDTRLVSVLAANGELGTLQPVTAVGAACREHGLLFHTDATQAVGKVPVDVDAWNVDLLAMSSHKIYGPKGVGALYVRTGTSLDPLVTGGGQERGFRSGTLNVAGIVGLGAAARICREETAAHSRRLASLTRELWEGIRRIVPDAVMNGHPEKRIPGTLNVALPRIDSGRVMLALERFALSASSACHSGSGTTSPVFSAIGLDPELAACSLRFGLGRATTSEHIGDLLAALGKAVRRLRGPVPGATPSPVRYD